MPDDKPTGPLPPDHPDWPLSIEPPAILKELARGAGGTIDNGEAFVLPDGSGFATMSMPLPRDHWLTQDDGSYDPPPMRLRMGKGARTMILQSAPDEPPRSMTVDRDELAELIREAGRYAYRANTNKGKVEDQDPDSFLQNLVVGLLGYWTDDGRTDDEWALPIHERGKREQR